MAETSHSAMGPHSAVAAVGLASKPWTAVFREALVVKTQAEGGSGLGEGGKGEGSAGGGGEGDGGDGGGAGEDSGGGEGDGGGAGGDDGGGEGQCFVSHFLNFLSHFVHFFFLPPAASTPFARRSEMRSMIMSFIVWALRVPARQGA